MIAFLKRNGWINLSPIGNNSRRRLSLYKGCNHFDFAVFFCYFLVNYLRKSNDLAQAVVIKVNPALRFREFW